MRRPIALMVLGSAAFMGATFLGSLLLDARRRVPKRIAQGAYIALRDNRRQYAGYVVHLGFMAVAIGVTGSSLGARRHEAVMSEGEKLRWADREIRYVELVQRELPDKLVAEAVLEVSRGEAANAVTLRPARHLHLLQNDWTTEVAIHSTWAADFYVILHAGLGEGKVVLTFIENPLLRWIWCGGLISLFGAGAALWPAPRGKLKQHARTLPPSDADAPETHRWRAA
jgi:cytochrome c-type biogenesis protein CcmF